MKVEQDEASVPAGPAATQAGRQSEEQYETKHCDEKSQNKYIVAFIWTVARRLLNEQNTSCQLAKACHTILIPTLTLRLYTGNKVSPHWSSTLSEMDDRMLVQNFPVTIRRYRKQIESNESNPFVAYSRSVNSKPDSLSRQSFRTGDL